MSRVLKKFAVVAALAGLWCGSVFALDAINTVEVHDDDFTTTTTEGITVTSIDGSTTSLTITGDLTVKDNNANVNGYILTGEFARLIVEGNTTITDGAVNVGRYGVAEFHHGVEVGSGGTLSGVSTFGDSIVNVGTADFLANVLVKNGGTLNDTKLVNLYSEKARLYFSGEGNTVTGAVTANDFDISVDGDVAMFAGSSMAADTYSQYSGNVTGTGSITANNTSFAAQISGKQAVFAVGGVFNGGLDATDNATIYGTGQTITGRNSLVDMNVNSGARIDLSKGKMKIENFGNVNIGSILIGVTGSDINMLNAKDNTAVTLNLRDVELTNELNAKIHDNGMVGGTLVSGATINNGKTSTRTISTIYGDYTINANKGGTGVKVGEVRKTVLEDLEEVKTQLGKIYGDKLISDGLADGMAGMAINSVKGAGFGYEAKNTTAGQLNKAILTSLMNSNSNWEFTKSNGSVLSGRADHSALAMYNGQTQAGVNYVAEDTMKEIFGSLHSRLDAFRKVKEVPAAIPEIDAAVEAAYGSLAVPECNYGDRYLNRIWAGGLGTWQNADKRKGFDGYKYDGKGLILGFDRAHGAAMFGAAVAYVEGDYEDKTATRHDSEIKHYSANVYATYNNSQGFFYTLMGGYTYSDNDIRETRGGRVATEDYHTNTWSVGAKTGFDFEPSATVVITPSVGVNFIHSKSNAHDLNYAGTANIVRYGDMKHHAVEIPFDIQIAKEINLGKNRSIQLSANGGYAYNLNDKGVVGNLSAIDAGFDSYRAIGRRLGHHSWKAGAGARLKMDQWDIGVKYDYVGRDNYNAHRVMGTVGYSF